MQRFITLLSRSKNVDVPPSAETRLHGRWLLIIRIAWLIETFVSAGMIIASFPLTFTQFQTLCDGSLCSPSQLTTLQGKVLQTIGISVTFYATLHLLLHTVFVLAIYGLATIIIWHRSDERMPLFYSFIIVALGVSIFLGDSAPLIKMYPLLEFPYQFFNFLQGAGFLFIFCLFPNGYFVPRWSRWVAFVGVGPAIIESFFPQLLISKTVWVWIVGSMIIGAYPFAASVQFYRYRWVSTRIERQQTKWLLFSMLLLALGASAIYLPQFFVSSWSQTGLLYSLVTPFVFECLILLTNLATGIAILRYRLWDVDILINRTLVYVGLSASVIGIYIVIVLSAGSLFQAQGNILISLFATAVIAILFQPLRGWLQRRVNRLMFGERDEPYRVLARLGQRLETTLTPDELIPTIVETVALALKVPFAAISWHPETAATASNHLAVYGEIKEERSLEYVPLVYQTITVGYLMLAPRQRGEALTPPDRRLLNDLAPQIGAAMHAIHLTADLKQANLALQHSRERLVTTREEERRRLRRDLHDGLGPQLSSQVLTLTAARTMLHRDIVQAETLMSDAIMHAQEAIVDIRRLVYALRPPALDDLGLLAALQEQISRYRNSGVQILLHAPQHLPPLPAAVEIACYRIAQEALTNVIRHAHAQHCDVQLSVGAQLNLEISDDGQGLPSAMHYGVGLNSMRERAEELGGTLELVPGVHGGLSVCTCLPFGEKMQVQ